ncbi:MAG TPA: ABC transporter permease subunit [Roseiflexaceae bacterium]|nr:ABC transporter permease subunit [Roseiflexaceae bacterium]
MTHILIILHKEWLELRQQRGLLAGMVALPLLFSLLPLAALLGARASKSTGFSMDDLPPVALINPALAGLDPVELVQALAAQQMSILFVLLPIILPSIIASYTIVGEKTGRTLEPLLATPVRTWELLAGKGLAAVLPSVLLTWLSAGVFAAEVALLAASPRVVAAVLTPGWALVILLCAPLLVMIAVGGMVAVSSRVNDPRTAQQYSALGIVPFMMLFFGQLAGVVVLGPLAALAGALVLALLAALTLWGATRLFEREVILTRWK